MTTAFQPSTSPAPQGTPLDALPGGVFRAIDAVTAGVGRQQLRRLQGDGHIERVGPGLYSIARTEPLARNAWVLARVRSLQSDVIVAHASAAAVWGLRVPYATAQGHRELTVLRSREHFGARLAGDVRILPAQFASSHVVERDGVRVTTLARTALDLARNCSFERALVVLDHALALGADRDDLAQLARYMSGWPGTRVFRPAIRWADGAVESGLESLARGRALAQQLPAPQLQVPVVGSSGSEYRGDLGWVKRRVILELDGRQKYEAGVDALFAEKRREDDLRSAGWTIVRMVYDDAIAPDGHRWRALAQALDVPLHPYDRDFGMTPRWERHRRNARR